MANHNLSCASYSDKRMRDQKGISLITTLLVMVIAFSIIGAVIYFISRGYKTYTSYMLYEKAFQKAQGGLEEAVVNILKKGFSDIKSFSASSLTGANYEIYQVFWTPLTGSGGSVNFPPVSSAYTGTFGVGVFYLIHSYAIESESRADIYALYIKGY